MARITFSIPDELAAAAERRASADRRSLSAHISMLVEADARAAGMISVEGAKHAELIAAAEEAGIDDALAAVRALHSSRKRRKRVA